MFERPHPLCLLLLRYRSHVKIIVVFDADAGAPAVDEYVFLRESIAIVTAHRARPRVRIVDL